MPKHGTEHMYINHGCRCDKCKAAASTARNKRRAEANRRLLAGEITVTHGNTSTYTYYGCRCEECREATSIYYADLRRRRANGEPPKRGRKRKLPQPVTLSPPVATGRFRSRLRRLVRT